MDCSGSTPEKNQSNTAHGQRAAQDSTGGGGQSMTPVSTSSKLVTTRAIAPYNGHQHSEGAHSATENDKIEMIPLLPVSTASQSLSGDVPSKTPPSIGEFPVEIMEAIVKLLPNKATLICLGLTCKSFYAMMKLKVPGKLDLWAEDPYWDGKHQPDCLHSLKCRCSGKLGRLLEGWFGAKYRLSYGLDSLQFLNIEIFGDAFDAYNLEERRLARRYDDYEQAFRDGRKLLPYPYYMGASWYGAAIEVITKDLQHWDKWQERWKFWDHCYVFRDIKNKAILERMVDDFIRKCDPKGIALMDF